MAVYSTACYNYYYRITYEFAGRGREAEKVLKRKPADTAGLDDAQMLVVGGEVAVLVDTGQRRHCVDGQYDSGHDDEQHRHDRQHLTTRQQRNTRVSCHSEWVSKR